MCSSSKYPSSSLSKEEPSVASALPCPRNRSLEILTFNAGVVCTQLSISAQDAVLGVDKEGGRNGGQGPKKSYVPPHLRGKQGGGGGDGGDGPPPDRNNDRGGKKRH